MGRLINQASQQPHNRAALAHLMAQETEAQRRRSFTEGGQAWRWPRSGGFQGLGNPRGWGIPAGPTRPCPFKRTSVGGGVGAGASVLQLLLPTRR